MCYYLCYNLKFEMLLQIRGHAMFSDEGRSLDEETLEYAWMIEIQLGKLSGRITMPQVKNKYKLELCVF